jgi:hypothetical protein
VFFVYDTPLGAGIYRCRFLENRYEWCFTINVGSGPGLEIRECCFTGREAQELCPKIVNVVGCVFEGKLCSLEQFDVNGGFDPEKIPRSGEKIDIREILGVRSRLAPILMTAAGISLVVSVVITYVRYQIVLHLVDVVKIPRALT